MKNSKNAGDEESKGSS